MRRHHALRRLFTYGLGGIFAIFLAAPLCAAPPTGSDDSDVIHVAVTKCVDLTGGQLGDVDRIAREALCLALSAADPYEVVPDGDGADRIIVASVQALRNGSKRPQIRVALAAESRDARTDRPIFQAIGRASTGGHSGARVAQAALVQAAMDKAAQSVVAQMKKADETNGIVIETQMRGRARVNLGRNVGVRPGTEFAVYEDGKYVATLKAKDISASDTNCYIVEQVEGTTLDRGDDVKIVSIPEKAKEKTHHKSRKTAIIFGTLAVAGLTYLLVDNSWKGKKLADHTIQSVTADPQTIKGDGATESLITAVVLDKNGQLVGNGVPVTFQVASDLSSAPGTLKNTNGDAASLVIEPTVNGVATVKLTSTLPQGAPDGIVFVRATSGKGTGISPGVTVTAPTT